MRTTGVVLVVLSLLWACVALTEESQGGEGAVHVSEIRSRGVVGDLGVVLGTIVTVEGEAVDGDVLQTKEDSGELILRVDTVGGKALAKPKMYHFARNASVTRPEPGERFAFVAYETGAFVGAPDGVFDYILAYATTSFYFKTELVLLADAATP